MKRRPDELTPRQIAALRRDCGSLEQFHTRLAFHGYVEMISKGCFKRLFRFPRGRYIIKTDGDEHIMHQNRTYPALHRKGWVLTLLARGRDYQVQRYVKECRRMSCAHRRMKEKYDVIGHNHTHIGRRTFAFDW